MTAVGEGLEVVRREVWEVGLSWRTMLPELRSLRPRPKSIVVKPGGGIPGKFSMRIAGPARGSEICVFIGFSNIVLTGE